MAVVNLTATQRKTNDDLVPGAMVPGALITFVATVTVGSADSATSTYTFFDIPTTLRISAHSRIYWDDLASSGAPTLDFGLFGAQITNDDDAFVADKDAATANTTGAMLLSDHANAGKRAYELVNGQTTDPKGFLTVKATLKDADVNVGGDLTVELVGYFD